MDDSIPKLLRHHQTVHASVHDTDAGAAKFPG